MTKIRTLFLKLALGAIAILLALVAVVFARGMMHLALVVFKDWDWLIALGLAFGIGISVVLFYGILMRAYNLLQLIERVAAFSEQALAYLRHINMLALGISVVYAVMAPVVFRMADKDDAPGLFLLVLVLIGAGMTISVFATILRQLLRQALEMKQELELTV